MPYNVKIDVFEGPFDLLLHLVRVNEMDIYDISIADIANWCWVRTYKWSGVSREGLENLDRWLNVMKQKPGLRQGIEVPVKIDNILEDKEASKKFRENANKMVQR